jgi:hypothetical protein
MLHASSKLELALYAAASTLINVRKDSYLHIEHYVLLSCGIIRLREKMQLHVGMYLIKDDSLLLKGYTEIMVIYVHYQNYLN